MGKDEKREICRLTCENNRLNNQIIDLTGKLNEANTDKGKAGNKAAESEVAKNTLAAKLNTLQKDLYEQSKKYSDQMDASESLSQENEVHKKALSAQKKAFSDLRAEKDDLDVLHQQGVENNRNLASRFNAFKQDSTLELNKLRAYNRRLNTQLFDVVQSRHSPSTFDTGYYMWNAPKPDLSLNDIAEKAYMAEHGKSKLAEADHNMIAYHKYVAMEALNLKPYEVSFTRKTEHKATFDEYVSDSTIDLNTTNYYHRRNGNLYSYNSGGPAADRTTKRNIEFAREYKKSLENGLTVETLAQAKYFAEKNEKEDIANNALYRSILNVVIGGGLALTPAGEGAALLGLAGAGTSLLPEGSVIEIDKERLTKLYDEHLLWEHDKSTRFISGDAASVVSDIKNHIISSTDELNSQYKTHEDKLNQLIISNTKREKIEEENKEAHALELKIKKAEIGTYLGIDLAALAIEKAFNKPAVAKDAHVALTTLARISFAGYRCLKGALTGGPIGLAAEAFDALKDLARHFSRQPSEQEVILQVCNHIAEQVQDISIRLGRMEIVQNSNVQKLIKISAQINNLDFSFARQIAVISDQILSQHLDTIENERYLNKGKMIEQYEELQLQINRKTPDKHKLASIFRKMKFYGEYIAEGPTYTGSTRQLSDVAAFEKLFNESNDDERFALMPRALDLLDLDILTKTTQPSKLPDLTLWYSWVTAYLQTMNQLSRETVNYYRPYTVGIETRVLQIQQMLSELLSRDAMLTMHDKLESDFIKFVDTYKQNVVIPLQEKLLTPLSRLNAKGNFLRRLNTVLSDQPGVFDDFTNRVDPTAHAHHNFADAFKHKKPTTHCARYKGDNHHYFGQSFADHKGFTDFFSSLIVKDKHMHFFRPKDPTSVFYLKNATGGGLLLHRTKNPFISPLEAGLISLDSKGIVFIAGTLQGTQIPLTTHAVNIEHPGKSVVTITIFDDTMNHHKNSIQRFARVLPPEVMNNPDCLDVLTTSNIVHFAMNHYFGQMKKEALDQLQQTHNKRDISKLPSWHKERMFLKLELNLYSYLTRLLACEMMVKGQNTTASIDSLIGELGVVSEKIYPLLATENRIASVTPTHAGLRIRYEENSSDLFNDIQTQIDSMKDIVTQKMNVHKAQHVLTIPDKISLVHFDDLQSNTAMLLQPPASYWEVAASYLSALGRLPYVKESYDVSIRALGCLAKPGGPAVGTQAVMLTAAVFSGGSAAIIPLIPMAIDIKARYNRID